MPTNLIPSLMLQKRGHTVALDISRFFHNQLNVTVPMWNSPIQGFAFDQIEKALQNIMYKTTTPKVALASAQQACQSQLQRTLKSGGH